MHQERTRRPRDFRGGLLRDPRAPVPVVLRAGVAFVLRGGDRPDAPAAGDVAFLAGLAAGVFPAGLLSETGVLAGRFGAAAPEAAVAAGFRGDRDTDGPGPRPPVPAAAPRRGPALRFPPSLPFPVRSAMRGLRPEESGDFRACGWLS